MLSIYDTIYVICGIAGGLAAAALIYYLTLKDKTLDRATAFSCYVASMLGFFVGTHLLFFIVNIPGFSGKYGMKIVDVGSFIDAFLDASSGMVFYGGLFGAAAGAVIVCKARHIYARPYLNACACGLCVMHAFGRIGCSIDGCCYGIEYGGPLAIQYTPAHIHPGFNDHVADVSRFPVQPLESVLGFLVCFILVKLYFKYRDQIPLLPIYFIVYGIIRFLDEFLRGDEARRFWGPLATSQWIAIVSIAISAIYLAVRSQKSRVQVP